MRFFGFSILMMGLVVGAIGRTVSLPPSSVFRLIWQTPLKGKATEISYPVPFPSGNRFFVATSGKNGGVYAVSGDTGRILWKSRTPGGLMSLGPGKSGTTVVLVAAEDGKVYGIDAGSGTTLFTLPTEIVPSVAPIATDLNGDHVPEILVLSATAGMGVFDGKDFQSLWVYSSEAGFLAAPIVRDFTGKGKHEILITDRAGKVALIDGQSGRELWTAAMGNAAVGAGILWESPSGPVVIVGSRDQWVYAFRATNGELLWRYYARNPVSSRLFHAISPQGWNLAIFCAEGQGIQALNLQWQFLQWRYDFRGNCVGEPLIANVIGDAEPEVIVVSDRKVVHTVTGSQASITFLDMLELPGTPASGAGVLFRGLDRAGLLAVTVTDLKLPRTPVGSVILGYSFHPLSPPDVSYPVAGLAGQDSTL